MTKNLPAKSRFYCYTQNNSGGDFYYDGTAGIGRYVIVEALDMDEANSRAESIGLYFNGCDDDIDCSCCGDRWYEQWDERDGDDEPNIYGQSLTDVNPVYTSPYSFGVKNNEFIGFIHYLDGIIVPIRYEKESK